MFLGATASAALLTGPLAHATAGPRVFAQVPGGATVTTEGVISDSAGSVIGVLEGTPAANPVQDVVEAATEATAPVVEAAEPVTEAAAVVTQPALEAAAPVVDAADEAIAPAAGGPVVGPVTQHVAGGGADGAPQAPPAGGPVEGGPAGPAGGGTPTGGGSGGSGGSGPAGVPAGNGAPTATFGGAVSSQGASGATPVDGVAGQAGSALGAVGIPNATLVPSLGSVAGGVTSFLGSSALGSSGSSSPTLQPLPPMVATPFEYLGTTMADVVAPAVAEAESAGHTRIQLPAQAAELATDVAKGGARPASVLATALLGVVAATQLAIRRYAPLGVWQR